MNVYLMKKFNLAKISLISAILVLSCCSTLLFITHEERTTLKYAREDSLFKNLGISSGEQVRSLFLKHCKIYRFYTNSFPTFSRCFAVTPNEEVFSVMDHNGFNRLIEYENILIKEPQDVLELVKFYLNITFPYYACSEYIILNELNDIPGFSEKDLERESKLWSQVGGIDSLLKKIEKQKHTYKYEKFPWLPEDKCQDRLEEMYTLKNRFHPMEIKREDDYFSLRFYTWISAGGEVKYHLFKIYPDGKISEECYRLAIFIGAFEILK